MMAEVVSLSVFFLPLALCGWMVGRLHRIGTWVGLGATFFLLLLFVFAFARAPDDPRWSTIWLTAAVLFFVPALIGTFTSELRKYRDERQNG